MTLRSPARSPRRVSGYETVHKKKQRTAPHTTALFILLFVIHSCGIETMAVTDQRDDGRRRLDGGGKKGGKKDVCAPSIRFLDGEDLPMVCGFPVKLVIPCRQLAEFQETQSGEDSIEWEYYTREEPIKAVNLDTHETWYSPAPFVFTDVRVRNPADSVTKFTNTGRALLFLADETTGLESLPVSNGPTIQYIDGFWQGKFDRETNVYFDNVVDASVIDVCVELA
mmetsp:Transcript_25260/g.52562  ORF Transcript_25260/g.52562 Transcript_25260/m.52562 type:complete len:225 (-) Transcript_25260:174-848(-)